MKNKTDFFIGLTLLAFCCAMGYEIYLIPEPAALDFLSAGSFLMGITIVLALLSLVPVARAVLGRDESVACWPERKLAAKIGLMAAWILIYVIGFIFLGEHACDAEWLEGMGFVISTLVSPSRAQVLAGYRNPFYISLISAGISVLLCAVFAILSKVPLPQKGGTPCSICS